MFGSVSAVHKFPGKHFGEKRGGGEKGTGGIEFYGTVGVKRLMRRGRGRGGLQCQREKVWIDSLLPGNHTSQQEGGEKGRGEDEQERKEGDKSDIRRKHRLGSVNGGSQGHSGGERGGGVFIGANLRETYTKERRWGGGIRRGTNFHSVLLAMYFWGEGPLQ